MSDQPSTSQPSTSTSGGQAAVEEITKKMKKMKVKKSGKPSEPTAEEKAALKQLDLEREAIRAELRLRVKGMQACKVVDAFVKMRKELQDQMLKRSFMRRMLVMAVHDKTRHNQNNTMNVIKKITNRKKCPVEMPEIEFCIRRLQANETVDLDSRLEVLLEQEQLKKRMLETPENPDLVVEVHNLLRENPNIIIDCVDIRVNMWMLDMTFIGINIGKFYPSSVLRNHTDMRPGEDDQTVRAFIDIVAFLELCHEAKRRILRMNVTIGGNRKSREFLKMMLDPHQSRLLNVDSFQLKSIGRTVSDSLIDCKYIKPQVLEITVGRFMNDSEEKFEAAMKYHTNLQSLHITSKDAIPPYYCKWETYGYGFYEVITGIEDRTGDKYVVFEKTGRRAFAMAEKNRRRSV